MYLSPLFHNTRPEGPLLPQEEAAFDMLERLCIDYDRVSSDPADNMEKCAAVSAVLGMPICKNLFLCNRQKTKFYLLAMGPDQALPHQGPEPSDRLCPSVLRPGGGALEPAALHARLRHCAGPHERHGARRNAAHGAGGLRLGVVFLPPLHLHQQSEAAHGGSIEQVPASHRTQRHRGGSVKFQKRTCASGTCPFFRYNPFFHARPKTRP